MSRVFELAFALSGKINNSVRSSFGGLNREVNDLNSKIAQMERSRGNITRFKGLRTDIINTNREFNTAQETVNRLAREIRNTTNPSRQLQTEFERARRNTVNLNSRLRDQRTELGQVRERLDQAGVSTRNLSGEQERLERTIERTTRAQARYSDSRQRLNTASAQTAAARGKLVDAVAMSATLVVPVRLAMSAEETMADINKVANFDNEEELRDMERKIMEMNTKGKIPMAFNELGQIIASGAQAGINKIELPKFASDAAKMGVAMNMEAGEAGQTMAGWRSAFRMNQDEVVNLSDKVNYLGNTTAASAPKITDFVTRIGALGEVGGVNSGEIAALGATLIGMNIPTEVASTATSKFITTLNKGSSATKKQQGAFRKLGLDAKQMAKIMQEDAQKGILDTLNALKQLPEQDKIAVINDLFGETGTKAVAPLLNNIKELEENLLKVDETQRQFSGSMEKEFQTRVETSANSMQILKNNLANVSIILGSVLLPPIVMVTEKLGSIAFKVQEFAQKYPNLTKAVVIGAAAFLALNVALIAGVYVGRLLKESYLSVGHGINKLRLLWVEGKIQAIGQTIATKALSVAQFAQAGVAKVAAVAQGALNAVMSANPIALVIMAIVALIGVGVLLYKNWDKVKETLSNLWSMFADKFPGMAAFAETAAGVIKDTFGKAIEWVSGKVEWLGSAWDKTAGKLFKKNKGGNSSSGNLPAYAKGGIVSSPQIALIGEGGSSEAIIPLEKTANSIGLWEKTGRALGVNMSPNGIDIASRHSSEKNINTNKSSSGEKYEFNFNIDAKGATPGVEDSIKDKFLREVIPVIMRLLEEKERDKLRISINNG